MEYTFYNFSSGLDLLNSLNNLQNNLISKSFLISAVGDLSKVTFKCPTQKSPLVLEKKLEIISLNGYLTSKESHIHISVSDENCAVFGGHLLPGSIVLRSLDVLLGVIPDLKKQTIFSVNNSSVHVDIYILPDCPWSKRALKLLDSFQIKYNYFIINTDDEFIKIRSRTSFNTFPQIFINNEFIGGYSELSELSSNGQLIKLCKSNNNL